MALYYVDVRLREMNNDKPGIVDARELRFVVFHGGDKAEALARFLAAADALRADPA